MRTSEDWGVDAHNPPGSRRWRSSVFATSLLAASLLYAHVVAAGEPTEFAVPDGLYPRPSPAAPVPPDRGRSATRVAELTLEEMIAIAAYSPSLQP